MPCKFSSSFTLSAWSTGALIILAGAHSLFGQSSSQGVTQTAEVIEAYRVCQHFQKLMSEDLNFDQAFEATFTRDAKRRREIAITEGEFGNLNLARVDDALLISAFKSRMQIFYLMLPLVSPESKAEEALFFSPEIKRIVERKPPKAPNKFRAFSLQLRRDAANLRAHLESLASKYPDVAERIRKFKQEELSKNLEPPDHLVRPLTTYSRGRVLALDEPYYQINEYALIREDGQMRIIGIRFFTRLF